MKPIISLIFFLACTCSSALAVDFRVVAVTGVPAPGTPTGVVFEDFGGATINDAGETAFTAELRLGTGGVTTTNERGIWSEGTGSLALIAREGSQAPGMPSGVNFGDALFAQPIINNAGQTAFEAPLQPGSGGVTISNDDAVWSEGTGSLALVARRQSIAPGTTTGFSNFSSVHFNDLGQTTFWATLSGISGNSSGTWMGGPGSLSLVAREGSQAPGLPVGARFGNFGSTSPPINGSGVIAFGANLVPGAGGVNSGNDTGIWVGGADSLSLLVREGDPAPGTPIGTLFDNVRSVLGLNHSGETAFRAFLQNGIAGVTSDNDTGVWSNRDGSLALIAREGSQVPGLPPGVNFGSFFSGPLLNSAGDIAFMSTLQVGSGGVTADNDSLLGLDRSGVFSVVAREGDQAPGAPNGAVFAGFSGYSPMLNTAGQMAFRAALLQGQGGVTANNDFGIWARDANGVLQLLVREGDFLEVMPGVFRRVLGLSTQADGGAGPEDGQLVAFNSKGQLAFYAQFTDGSSGVFVATQIIVPEPASALMLSAITPIVVRLTSRRRRLLA